MKLLERVFTGIALVGVGMVCKNYYEKHYVKEVPKNHHMIVEDRRHNRYATNEEKVMLLPYWQTSELLRSKERFEIKSKAASKDNEIVNVHLLVDSELKDVMAALGKYGKDIELTTR